MRDFAVIQNGVVTNIVYASDSYTSDTQQVVMLDSLMPVDIGDKYDGQNFLDADGNKIKSLYESLQDKYNDLIEEYLQATVLGE